VIYLVLAVIFAGGLAVVCMRAKLWGAAIVLWVLCLIFAVAVLVGP
jgi:hypothetical protein